MSNEACAAASGSAAITVLRDGASAGGAEACFGGAMACCGGAMACFGGAMAWFGGAMAWFGGAMACCSATRRAVPEPPLLTCDADAPSDPRPQAAGSS